MLRSSEIKPLFVDLSLSDKSFSFFMDFVRVVRFAPFIVFWVFLHRVYLRTFFTTNYLCESSAQTPKTLLFSSVTVLPPNSRNFGFPFKPHFSLLNLNNESRECCHIF